MRRGRVRARRCALGAHVSAVWLLSLACSGSHRPAERATASTAAQDSAGGRSAESANEGCGPLPAASSDGGHVAADALTWCVLEDASLHCESATGGSVTVPATDLVQGFASLTRVCGVDRSRRLWCAPWSHPEAWSVILEEVDAAAGTLVNGCALVEGDLRCFDMSARGAVEYCCDGIVQVTHVGDLVEVAGSPFGHICAARATGEVLCWGGLTGVDGDGVGAWTVADARVVASDSPLASIVAVGRDAFCGRDREGATRCWGSGPVPCLGVDAASAVAGGHEPEAYWRARLISLPGPMNGTFDYGCIVERDGTLHCTAGAPLGCEAP